MAVGARPPMNAASSHHGRDIRQRAAPITLDQPLISTHPCRVLMSVLAFVPQRSLAPPGKFLEACSRTTGGREAMAQAAVEVKLRPLGDRVLVWPISREETTKSGIV